MKTEKNHFFSKKINFIFAKILLWTGIGLSFISFSVLIPANPDSRIKELIVFLCLTIVINIHTSYLYPIFSKKSKWGYVIVLIASIVICVFIEMLIFSELLENTYTQFLDRKKLYFVILGYIFIRNLALFGFFLWIEHFHQLILYYQEKERIYQKEMALLIEKQEFEKKFSRKKLLSHYFFNIFEHLTANLLNHNGDNEMLEKVKFILYYFLIDAEKEKVELDKEIAFYNYYIELEKFRHQKNISLTMNVLGQTENCLIIPLLFEPLINNAMKYTKQDGTGKVDIVVDATHLPILNFCCRNNYDHHSSNIVSSENGLKILEQRLELCYKDNYDLKIEQTDDLYEATLSIKTM